MSGRPLARQWPMASWPLRSRLVFASATVVVIGRPVLMRTSSSYHVATQSGISIRMVLQKLVNRQIIRKRKQYDISPMPYVAAG